MRIFVITLLYLLVAGCRQPQTNLHLHPEIKNQEIAIERSYSQIKNDIAAKRKKFKSQNDSVTITDYWVTAINNHLYSKWKGTAWDYNGITSIPGQGTVACGYFVTAILQDMGCKINRIRLSTCASSQMMKSLVPRQKIKNLSYLNYTDFNKAVQLCGKGVYIIGLDFHTGFIVNDGKENWFIHSNYIQKEGVIKEKIMNSSALQSSKTRWMVSLTGDTDFITRWLRS